MRESEEPDVFDWLTAYWRHERSLARNVKECQAIVGAMHEVEYAREVNRQDGRLRSTDSIDRPFQRYRRPLDLLAATRPPRSKRRDSPV